MVTANGGLCCFVRSVQAIHVTVCRSMPDRSGPALPIGPAPLPIGPAPPPRAVPRRIHYGDVAVSDARMGWADRLVRWTTTVSVVVLAVIAAIISYKHMFALVRRYGETSWTAALLPVSVDGMIAASCRCWPP
jgi:hypothetical protein